MREILATAKNIHALFSGTKYGVDYYQREYRWQKKHVADLLDDLAEKFLGSYDAAHERSAVESYSPYFLGSIIISERDVKKFIIDGQQRLTTLSLLLIYVHRLLADKSQLAELIFSQRFGKRSFNLDVPERTTCMEALFAGETVDDNDQPESVANIFARYQDIVELFPGDLTGPALPYFTDWLIENVHLVEITAYSDEDAYTIFETMNDRGLSLTQTDMLKGYLLASITDSERRTEASEIWKRQIGKLRELGKDEDANGIKAWLRSQHAETIRDHKHNAKPKDFDLIGTEFHRWVRENETPLGLNASTDFARFIDKDFDFYTRQYERLRRAADALSPGLECVYYNAQNNFTLQYPVLLAPLRISDSDGEILRKLRIAAAYIDILITRRIWNSRAIDYSTMQDAMFLVMREIRGKTAPQVAELLTKRLEGETETFASTDRFRLNAMNGRQILRLLARITDYVETSSGMASHYTEYVHRKGKNGYEIEHIWANHPERHEDEFTHQADFQEYRNRIGGLLLLPKSFNASYGDLPYAEKREHYLMQNLLAQSLHKLAYEHNPGFLHFAKEKTLPFKAHAEFKKADLDARQLLYRRLAEDLWTPTRLHKELASEAGAA